MNDHLKISHVFLSLHVSVISFWNWRRMFLPIKFLIIVTCTSLHTCNKNKIINNITYYNIKLEAYFFYTPILIKINLFILDAFCWWTLNSLKYLWCEFKFLIQEMGGAQSSRRESFDLQGEGKILYSHSLLVLYFQQLFREWLHCTFVLQNMYSDIIYMFKHL